MFTMPLGQELIFSCQLVLFFHFFQMLYDLQNIIFIWLVFIFPHCLYLNLSYMNQLQELSAFQNFIISQTFQILCLGKTQNSIKGFYNFNLSTVDVDSFLDQAQIQPIYLHECQTLSQSKKNVIFEKETADSLMVLVIFEINPQTYYWLLWFIFRDSLQDPNYSLIRIDFLEYNYLVQVRQLQYELIRFYFHILELYFFLTFHREDHRTLEKQFFFFIQIDLFWEMNIAFWKKNYQEGQFGYNMDQLRDSQGLLLMQLEIFKDSYFSLV